MSFLDDGIIRQYLRQSAHKCFNNRKLFRARSLAKIAPSPTSAIDIIAKEHGHEVMRTPPYHPELQPMQLSARVYYTF